MSDSTVRLEVDRSRCVLCGGPNECALAMKSATSSASGAGEATAHDPAGVGSEEPCWCVDAHFPEALTGRANERDGGASCICRRCLDAYSEGRA